MIINMRYGEFLNNHCGWGNKIIDDVCSYYTKVIKQLKGDYVNFTYNSCDRLTNGSLGYNIVFNDVGYHTVIAKNLDAKQCFYAIQQYCSNIDLKNKIEQLKLSCLD